MKKDTWITIVLLLLFFNYIPFNPNNQVNSSPGTFLEISNPENTSDSSSTVNYRFSDLIDHKPINILSDQDLLSHNFTGYGNESHPFIIENFRISTLSDVGIRISNTTKHFTIRNCFVTGTAGIRVTNVSESTSLIEYNVLHNCTNIGIFIDETNSSSVRYNIISPNITAIYAIKSPKSFIDHNYIKLSSIKIIKSEYTNISNNNCSRIIAEESPYTIIERNNCSEGIGSSISINYCNYAEILENRCTRNSEGISTSHSHRLKIINNYLCYNGASGINCYGTKKSNITDNICSFNKKHGIQMFGCKYLRLENNVFSSNGDCGIYLRDLYRAESKVESTIVNNLISHNVFGIRFYDSRLKVISNNTISKNIIGIILRYSVVNKITFNILEQNERYGVQLLDSDNNTIYLNDFVENNLYGTNDGYSQGFDNGDYNSWSNLETFTGNYWTNMTNSDSYLIDGSANNADLYPSPLSFRYVEETTPTPTPTPTPTITTLDYSISLLWLFPIITIIMKRGRKFKFVLFREKVN